MLVDLARNDVNRVCKPETVNVDSLMQVEKFSHVMHLTSQVSGKLRDGKTRWVSFDCFSVNAPFPDAEFQTLV
jgi:anthranilate synthase component 1